MQFASFDLADPVFVAGDLLLSVQLVTLRNLYGLDPERTELVHHGGGATLRASRLTWAGGQERAEGTLELRVESDGPRRVRLSVRARTGEPIRCTKILIRDLDPPLALVDADGAVRAVGEYGELLEYPTRLPTPLACVRAGRRILGMRALDPEVRAKRFAVWCERAGARSGRGVVELIHEADASRFAAEIASPPFVVGWDVDPDRFEAEHVAFLERCHGLCAWEARPDLPAWARGIRLVVTLHGMHWTGRVFLDYAAMLDALRFVADRIEGARVLAYLPGWEGRYYWQYGDYRPDERLGGEAGFARLCAGARELGVHVMPMFGANCANAWLPRFRNLDPAVHLKSATGNRFHGNTPDWDLSRSHDTGWQAWLNPGHPDWREELAGQIEALAARYPLDAVFLDTTEVWTNDPDHPVFPGLRSLVERLRRSIPDLLVAGEYDYDALLSLFPLFQRAWWTSAPRWTRRFVRRFAHLCEGEPEGRTGVHELGTFRTGAVAGAPGLLATIALQDGTLERSRGAIEAAIVAAAAP